MRTTDLVGMLLSIKNLLTLQLTIYGMELAHLTLTETTLAINKC